MAGYWFPHEKAGNDLFIASAVKAQENVGAFKRRSRYNPGAKRKAQERQDRRIENPAEKAMEAIEEGMKIDSKNAGTGSKGSGLGSGVLNRLGSGAAGFLDRIKGLFGSRDGSNSGKGLKFSDMTPDDFAAIGDAAVGVLNAADMLTGGQDEILQGSGHTYSSGYNPEMYIGQGPGY
jgi:hypothetical protein